MSNKILIKNKRLIYQNLKAPITAQIELTPRCNNKCLYCYNYWKTGNNYESELGAEEMRKISKIISENEIFRVVLTGGEPLLRKDLVYSLAQGLSSEGVIVKLNTNLALLEEEDIEKIRSSNISGLFVSLSSCYEDTYNKITQSSNFQKVIRNIEYVVKGNIPISVNMVVTQLNKKQIYATGKYLWQMGVTSFAATPVIPCVYLNSQLELSEEDIISVLNDLLKIEEEFKMHTDIVEALPKCAIKDSIKYNKFLTRDCGAGKFTCAISSSGKVRPCTHIQKEYGDILKSSFTDIWNKMGQWRDGEFIPIKCSECKKMIDCSMGCREAAKTKSGSYSELDPRSNILNIPNNIKTEKKLVELNENTRLKIVKGIKYRHEKHGILLYSQITSSILYVNEQLYNIICSLSKLEYFTLKSVLLENKMNNEINNIIKYLFIKKIVIYWN